MLSLKLPSKLPSPLVDAVSATPVRPGSEIDFALRMGRALHAYGTPSHRLEDALAALCSTLGLKSVAFFSTPTALFASIETGAAPEVHLLRVQSRGVDLGKLAELDAVSAAVTRGESTPSDGLARIEAIEGEAPRYGAPVLAAAYAINSGAACVILGGGWKESAVAVVIGLVTGLLSSVASRPGRRWRAFEPAAAFFASLLATLAAALLGSLALHLTVLAGLIALLPGYTLTVAIAELASRHLASGSARLTGAGMSFLALGFGVALGNRVVEWGFGAVTVRDPVPLPVWAFLVALPIAVVSFSILFQALRRDVPFILLATGAGLVGAKFGAEWLGAGLGSFLGAFAATLVANGYARRWDRPAVVPLFPALMLLVPGSIGFRSFSLLMAQDVIVGVQTAFDMVLVAVALVAGLLVANDLLPPRRAL